jgi:hypothetical protein
MYNSLRGLIILTLPRLPHQLTKPRCPGDARSIRERMDKRDSEINPSATPSDIGFTTLLSVLTARGRSPLAINKVGDYYFRRDIWRLAGRELVDWCE